MATDEEREHAARLLKIHRDNLQRLLEQRAKYGGVDVPLVLENQIAETRSQIAIYEPLAPSPRTQATAQGMSIDLTTLYIQNVQIAVEQARQADQNKEIIDQQARDAVWRVQAKEVIDELVSRVAASETERQKNAPFMRRVMTIALALSVLALMVSCVALIVVRQ